MTFVVFVYTSAVMYGGFWLGARYQTLTAMKDRLIAWIASLGK